MGAVRRKCQRPCGTQCWQRRCAELQAPASRATAIGNSTLWWICCCMVETIVRCTFGCVVYSTLSLVFPFRKFRSQCHMKASCDSCATQLDKFPATVEFLQIFASAILLAADTLGRQHQGMDRSGVCQAPEGSGEQGTMEETGCKIICGAPMTLRVKGLMMMVITLCMCIFGKCFKGRECGCVCSGWGG